MNTSSPRIERIAVVDKRNTSFIPQPQVNPFCFIIPKQIKIKQNTQKNNTLARHQIIDAFYYEMHIKWLYALHYECDNANKTFFGF